MIRSIFIDNSIKLELNVTDPFFLSRINLRPFLERALKNPLYLWTISGIRLNKTPNTNRTKIRLNFLPGISPIYSNGI